MDRCPPIVTLEALLAETLAGDEQAVIETHIERCKRCQLTLHNLTLADENPSKAGSAPARVESKATHGSVRAEAFFVRLKLIRPSTSLDGEKQTGSTEDRIGEPFRVEGYEILGELGRGAAGVVYRARHHKLNRLVALKVIVAGPQLSPEARRRFQVEAHTIARLQHPNIVQIYDIGEQSERPFLSLELVEGGSLADWIAGKPKPANHAAEIVGTLADAVEYAHRQSIVHRDLKPGNVLFSVASDPQMKRQLKITDFGIAKILPQAGIAEARMTQTGELLGTPAYMAPEQIRGKLEEICPATDVYALGVILYELLTGRPPFQGATPLDTLMQAAHHDPLPISLLVRGSPRDLNTICLKCLEKEPGKRYATAAELGADIGRFLRNEPILARPLSWIGRGVRWTRRHRGVAASLAGVALSLILLAVVSLLAMAHFRALEHEQRVLAMEKGRLADEKDLERQRADKSRRQAQNREREALQNLYFDRMNLGSQTTMLPGAIGRIGEFLAPWSHEQVDLRNWEWYYLDSLCHRDLRTLYGHKNGVLCVAWSPDGHRVASGSFDNTVRIWNAADGHELRLLSGHTFEVNTVAWSPDGRRLAAATGAGTVKIWDADTGQEMFSFRNGQETVFAVAWSPDGRHIASGGRDHTIRIWDPRTGAVQNTFSSGNTCPLRDLAWSPGGKSLASGDENGDVRVWDPVTGKTVLTMHGHSNFVNRVAWSPDGKRLASASNDNTVKIWDADTGTETMTLAGHTMGVACVTWSPDGARLATASNDQTIKVWQASDGAELFRLRSHTLAVTCVAWSPDGAHFASASWDATVKIWNANTGPEVPLLAGHTGSVFGLAWSPEGRRLASSSADGTIRIWDAAATKEPLVLRGHTDWVRSVGWSPNGARIASAGNDHTIRIWDATNGNQLNCIRVATREVGCVAWSPDGLRLASADKSYTIHIWDSVTGRELQTCEGHEGTVCSLAWSPDGKRLASGSFDRSVRVWDSATGKQIFSATVHRATVKGVAWSPDGLRLASASEDQTIIIWSATAMHVLTTLRGHTAEVGLVAWSPDGTRLASASDDHTVKIWDSVTGRETFTLDQARSVKVVAWRPDGLALAVGGDDPAVRIYDASAGYLAEKAPQYLPQLDRRLLADPKNSDDWLLRAEIDSRRVDWQEATTDAQHYLALNAAKRWLTLGYWVVGPYPENLNASYSPETDQDTGHPAIGTGEEDSPEFLGWRTTPVTDSGILDLGELFDHPKRMSAYAMLRVYCSANQSVAILLGADDQVRLWLNGKQVYENLQPGRAILDADAIPATLSSGWNTLLAREVNVTDEHGLYLRLSDETSDLIRANDAAAKK